MESEKSIQMNLNVDFPTIVLDLVLPFCTFYARCRMSEVCKNWKDCVENFQKYSGNEVEIVNNQSNIQIISETYSEEDEDEYILLFHKLDINSTPKLITQTSKDLNFISRIHVPSNMLYRTYKKGYLLLLSKFDCNVNNMSLETFMVIDIDTRKEKKIELKLNLPFSFVPRSFKRSNHTTFMDFWVSSIAKDHYKIIFFCLPEERYSTTGIQIYCFDSKIHSWLPMIEFEYHCISNLNSKNQSIKLPVSTKSNYLKKTFNILKNYISTTTYKEPKKQFISLCMVEESLYMSRLWEKLSTNERELLLELELLRYSLTSQELFRIDCSWPTNGRPFLLNSNGSLLLIMCSINHGEYEDFCGFVYNEFYPEVWEFDTTSTSWKLYALINPAIIKLVNKSMKENGPFMITVSGCVGVILFQISYLNKFPDYFIYNIFTGAHKVIDFSTTTEEIGRTDSASMHI